MTTIAVIGDPVLDQIYHTSDSLTAGGKMLGRYFGSVPGGTTANFACAAASFGLRPSMVGRVAANWEGDLHRSALEAAGVRVDNLQTRDVERGTHTIIAIGPDGEKTLIYVPFPEEPNASGVALDTMQNHDLAYIMAADFERIAPRIGQATAKICVDVDAAAGLDLDAFQKVANSCDVMFINDVGFEKLMGRKPNQKAVETLVAGRLACVCCTGGAGTSFVSIANPDGTKTSLAVDAMPATVVDTTGAGDCFNAAFLSQRVCGKSLSDIMKFATAAGALATEKTGARDAIPTRAQVLDRMEK